MASRGNLYRPYLSAHRFSAAQTEDSLCVANEVAGWAAILFAASPYWGFTRREWL